MFIDKDPRCEECNRMLARGLTPPWHIECPRCGTANRGIDSTEDSDDRSETSKAGRSRRHLSSRRLRR